VRIAGSSPWAAVKDRHSHQYPSFRHSLLLYVTLERFATRFIAPVEALDLQRIHETANLAAPAQQLGQSALKHMLSDLGMF
jgi:hypothetical protein